MSKKCRVCRKKSDHTFIPKDKDEIREHYCDEHLQVKIDKLRKLQLESIKEENEEF